MQITFTPDQEAFLKARFDTDDIQPFVEKYLNDWIDHMVEVAYLRLPPKQTKIQEATADIVSKKDDKVKNK